MKKSFSRNVLALTASLIFVCSTISSLTALADPGPGIPMQVNAPQPVKDAFAKQFPNATVQSWKSKKEGYIAKFKGDGGTWYAAFTADGTWHWTESPVKWTKNLPDSVQEGWKHSGYYNWYVEEIKKVDKPEGTKYILNVNNSPLLHSDQHDASKVRYHLYFSSGGKLLKKDMVH